MQIGVIGLGRMGGNISRRLIKNGHEVVVYDHDEKAVAALRSSQATDLEEAAHKLKGSCSNLGAARLRDLCQQLEKLGRDGSLQTAPELLASVEEEFGRVRTELVDALDRHRVKEETKP